MKLLTCPMNGPRPIDEFQYLGPWREIPDPEAASDAEWSAYLFRAGTLPGPEIECWRHAPSNFVFLAERDTRTDTVLRTFPVPRETQR